MALSEERALVLFSGGQDSTVCLAWALERFAQVETVGFDYDQRHAIELTVRPRLRERVAAFKPDWKARLRDDTIKAMQVALALGLDERITLHTPLMWIDKADTFAMADELGGSAFLALIVEDTHSCYLGDRTHRHNWGYGCGECPACKLRAQGFDKFMKQRGKQ